MKATIVKIIRKNKYPTSSKDYPEAHSEANNAEKKKYPKGYIKLKKIDKKVKPNELIGTHTKTGKIKISKKVPKKLRKEVIYHEKQELKAQKRLK